MSTATAQPIATGNWKIDTIHSHVGFAVKHMVVSTFRGRFEDYDGALVAGEDGSAAPRGLGQRRLDRRQGREPRRAPEIARLLRQRAATRRSASARASCASPRTASSRSRAS